MSLQPTRAQRRQLEQENRQWPEALRQVPREAWSPQVQLHDRAPMEAWRSRRFLVQIFMDNGVERLTVCRTSLTGDDYQDNIRWEDLQRLKAECGRGDRMAVEIFPPDADIVNVANMRHLWMLPEPLPFAWKRRAA